MGTVGSFSCDSRYPLLISSTSTCDSSKTYNKGSKINIFTQATGTLILHLNYYYQSKQ